MTANASMVQTAWASEQTCLRTVVLNKNIEFTSPRPPTLNTWNCLLHHYKQQGSYKSRKPSFVSASQPQRPRSHEKTPLCCHSGVRGLNRQLTCVSVKLESVQSADVERGGLDQASHRLLLRAEVSNQRSALAQGVIRADGHTVDCARIS